MQAGRVNFNLLRIFFRIQFLRSDSKRLQFLSLMLYQNVTGNSGRKLYKNGDVVGATVRSEFHSRDGIRWE